MPTYDRAAAKAAGLTDQEIDAYLASPEAKARTSGGATRAQEMGGRLLQGGIDALPTIGGGIGALLGVPGGPIGMAGGGGLGTMAGMEARRLAGRALGSDEGFNPVDLLTGGAMSAAIPGAPQAGSMIRSAAANPTVRSLAGPVTKFGLRRIPGVDLAIDTFDLVRDARRSAPAATPRPTPKPKAQPRPKPKPKAAPAAKAPEKPAVVRPKPNPGQRGKSKRELARDARDLDAIRARKAPQPGEPDLEAQLRQSLELERLMRTRGMDPSARLQARRGVREHINAGPSAAALAPLLMGGEYDDPEELKRQLLQFLMEGSY